MTPLLIALGAFIGAPTRYLTDFYVQQRFKPRLPLGTLTVNVVGSFVLGVVIGNLGSSSRPVAALVGTGFCGALTTFSTFSFETLSLFERGAPRHAWINVVLSLALGLAAAGLGLWIGEL